jgi:hypothetical protein
MGQNLPPETSESKQDGAYNLKEDENVLAKYKGEQHIQPGDKVNMPDMSGCTGAYAWDKNNNLVGAHHIFSGQEKTQGENFGTRLGRQGKPVHKVDIAASNDAKYDQAKTAINDAYEKTKWKDDPSLEFGNRIDYPSATKGEKPEDDKATPQEGKISRHKLTAQSGAGQVDAHHYWAEPSC